MDTHLIGELDRFLTTPNDANSCQTQILYHIPFLKPSNQFDPLLFAQRYFCHIHAQIKNSLGYKYMLESTPDPNEIRAWKINPQWQFMRQKRNDEETMDGYTTIMTYNPESLRITIGCLDEIANVQRLAEHIAVNNILSGETPQHKKLYEFCGYFDGSERIPESLRDVVEQLRAATPPVQQIPPDRPILEELIHAYHR